MIVRIAYQYGYLKHATPVTKHTALTPDIFELELSLPNEIPYTEGQFVYLQNKPGGESHPFTILSYEKESRILKIAYKLYGKFTAELSKI